MRAIVSASQSSRDNGNSSSYSRLCGTQFGHMKFIKFDRALRRMPTPVEARLSFEHMFAGPEVCDHRFGFPVKRGIRVDQFDRCVRSEALQKMVM